MFDKVNAIEHDNDWLMCTSKNFKFKLDMQHMFSLQGRISSKVKLRHTENISNYDQ